MRLSQLLTLALLSLAVDTGCAGGSANCDLSLAPGVPHSCPNFDNQPGTSQGVCRSGFGITSFCDPNLTCIDGTCIPCGFGDGPCCALPDGEHCSDPSVTCDQSEDLDWPTCPGPGECQIGEACCDHNCTGGMCNPDTNICEALPANVCSGSDQNTVPLIDPFGCIVLDQSITSDNDDDALVCAQAFLADHNPDGTLHLGPLDASEVCHDFCEISQSGNAPVGGHQCALTLQDLATCEQAQCTNCTIEDNTTCP